MNFGKNKNEHAVTKIQSECKRVYQSVESFRAKVKDSFFENEWRKNLLSSLEFSLDTEKLQSLYEMQRNKQIFKKSYKGTYLELDSILCDFDKLIKELKKLQKIKLFFVEKKEIQAWLEWKQSCEKIAHTCEVPVSHEWSSNLANGCVGYSECSILYLQKLQLPYFSKGIVVPHHNGS